MSQTINILLATLKGSKHSVQLNIDFTPADIHKIVLDKWVVIIIVLLLMDKKYKTMI
jgi:hypothetical protein